MPTSIQGLGLVDSQGNKSIVVNMSNTRQMTYTEYLQLTPAQRNGAIVVTDYPIPEEDDTVSVTADGVKTYATLLNELYALIDATKISQNSLLVVDFIAYKIVCVFTYTTSAEYQFSKATISSGNKLVTDKFVIKSANSTYGQKEENVTIDDRTSQQPTSGIKFTLHYGTSSEIAEINTDADHCMMSDGVTSVEDAITGLLKSKNITVTSNADGRVDLSLGYPSIIVVAAVASSGGHKIIPYAYQDKWYAILCDNTGGTAFNTTPNSTVALTIFYMINN